MTEHDLIRIRAEAERGILHGPDVLWLVETVRQLRTAIAEHHNQKADDRCIEDDDRLYAAANLPPCDRRVGGKEAMLANCARFIDRRCEAGGWPSYVELEAAVRRLRTVVANALPVMETAIRAGLDGFAEDEIVAIINGHSAVLLLRDALAR